MKISNSQSSIVVQFIYLGPFRTCLVAPVKGSPFSGVLPKFPHISFAPLKNCLGSFLKCWGDSKFWHNGPPKREIGCIPHILEIPAHKQKPWVTPVLANFYVNLTQERVILEERTSIKKMPVDKPVVHFWLMIDVSHRDSATPGQMVLDGIRKQAEQTSKQHCSMDSTLGPGPEFLPCVSSCPVFPQWWAMVWNCKMVLVIVL